MGHPAGGNYPEDIHVFPYAISLATQIPHAVGMGWGMKLRGEEACALTFFGDGSSSEGDFYESANLAGVLKAPVIFVLVNNGWAISTPTSAQTGAESFAAKAHAFGFPGIQVDGRDPLAVRAAVTEARLRAVGGQGPTLIEAVTYRLGHHTTADDPTKYREAEEVEAQRNLEPVGRFSAELNKARPLERTATCRSGHRSGGAIRPGLGPGPGNTASSRRIFRQRLCNSDAPHGASASRDVGRSSRAEPLRWQTT